MVFILELELFFKYSNDFKIFLRKKRQQQQLKRTLLFFLTKIKIPKYIKLEIFFF